MITSDKALNKGNLHQVNRLRPARFSDTFCHDPHWAQRACVKALHLSLERSSRVPDAVDEAGGGTDVADRHFANVGLRLRFGETDLAGDESES